MALTNSQYNTIMKEYEEKQLAARHALDDRINYVNRIIPEYQEITSQISSLSLQQATRLLDGDESALNELKKSIQQLRQKKKQLLLDAGLPSDYLEAQYECIDCKDTGYIGNNFFFGYGTYDLEALPDHPKLKGITDTGLPFHLS